ncbi:nitrite reductase/ring-hydroxylating ferredoxin subunit [Kribbella sp. VKM Ac-2527]|uniref:Cytochrome bc1 complex Rieske iron-sulfur subunit n=1 Tax=Kribbella caucasensis TaxID=2512215 RepID=A0A4V3CAG6_9ACTN|nr:Rieske (2Fe-2S) protein [Kribbella sp. VKM Ac-2527]TDO50588.1 nitrite reductase/ring-hydroxylating ferredoxin subunit [Kribbella sp. VKM Ac-2527]
MSKLQVERRTVLLAGGAAATTVVLTGCIVQQAPPPAAGTQPTSKAPVKQGTTGAAALAQVADIPAGGGVILKDQNVVLTKDASGKVCAFSAICTHQGCVVTGVGDGTINCACHGSKFDATTGERVEGPAQKPLPPVAVQQRDGAIFQA